MNGQAGLFESTVTGLPLIGRGKVRDIYAVDDEHLLIVACDRLSAFDVVLPDPIPGKGAVLTRVSNFWYRTIAADVPHHQSELRAADVITDAAEREAIGDRAVVVRRYQPLPVEAIVRGYLIGSGWKDYQRSGAVSGLELPAGMRQAEKLPETLFTPSSKASAGDHDENITFDDMADLIGFDTAVTVRDTAVRVYLRASAHAQARGIIIADTKFEFGTDSRGNVVLIDEVVTPDSSRFWPADDYAPGRSPVSYDKQFVRDYLETLDWDKRAPGPALPADIIERTAAKYAQAERRLTAEV